MKKDLREDKTLTEIYCAECGELKIIKQKDLPKYKNCFYCGSTDINEA